MRVLPQHALEHPLPQIGDRGQADIVDQVVAEVIADALEGEYAEDADGHHGPDIVDRRGHQRVQVDRVIENRYLDERDRDVRGGRVENAIENRTDQKRHETLRRTHADHQHYRCEKLRQVGPNEAQQPSQFSHISNPGSAPVTCSTAMASMSWDFNTTASVFHGAQSSSCEGPNKTTDGIPNAAAM